MLKIYKISKGEAIDFAAEELKKYLRMMNVEENEITIDYSPKAKEGFRLGLLCDFGIDESAEDDRFDDILYADCGTEGGVIGGNNARSVLLSVYEYLRKNGLRWLYPGPDGERIPMKKIDPVHFLIRPSCRYRGFANATAASYQTNLELIDFLPKVGMNTFMVEFRVPVFYTDNYYAHKRNEKHRPPEKVTNETILQWKRGCEAETAKRGLVFHDVGHGFCIDAFGIDSCNSWNQTDEACIPEDSRKYLAEVGGRRGFAGGIPVNTNFCMSNPVARKKFAAYVATYAEEHRNVDALHVWLSDGINAHCECAACRQKSPSDWYMDAMNAVDEEMTARGIDTKIVFIAYVDIVWAPEKTFLKNPERFIFMLAPFGSDGKVPESDDDVFVPPYERNHIYIPKTVAEYMTLYRGWKKNFNGPAFLFDYQLWWSQYDDISALTHCRRMNEATRFYKERGIDGVIQDGDMRCFLPNGVRFYTMARSLFDTSLTADEIIDDYFSHAYGKDFLRFKAFFERLHALIDDDFVAGNRSADPKVSIFYNPEIAENIAKHLPEILAEGEALLKEHYNSPIRIETLSARLFGHYLDFVSHYARVFEKKARGDDAGAAEAYRIFEDHFGKKECEIERYFNQCLFFNFLDYVVFGIKTNGEFALK